MSRIGTNNGSMTNNGGAEAPVKLRCGKLNNFAEWKTSQTNICTVHFGKQANVMKNNRPYEVPPATDDCSSAFKTALVVGNIFCS
jgi:hypothetical protein